MTAPTPAELAALVERLHKMHINETASWGQAMIGCAEAAAAIESLAAENATLRAELAAAQKDAERYRWIKEQADVEEGSFLFHQIILESTADDWDAKIDADLAFRPPEVSDDA